MSIENKFQEFQNKVQSMDEKLEVVLKFLRKKVTKK